MHKTARNPIVIKGNAMAIANAVELEAAARANAPQ